MTESPPSAVATFGGGCFWCLDAAFRELIGVLEVESGYAGGHVRAPSYEQVCAGTTGHAEVVRVRFDPSVIAYEDLLRVFFALHDPTTLNRQGADVGTQYRSIVLHHDEAQRAAAEAMIGELDESGVFEGPLVTELAPLEGFHPAEAYHQDYRARNAEQSYCRVVIDPKLAKLRRAFAHRLRSAADV